MEKRQLPVGVIQICWIEPDPSISATVNVVLAFITTLGLTFHPCPRSRDAPCPVPVVALPPAPLAPLKFSGLIERVLASESRNILPMLASMPLNLDGCCANNLPDRQTQMSTTAFFILADLSCFKILFPVPVTLLSPQGSYHMLLSQTLYPC